MPGVKLEFTVYGIPQPQGSMKAFMIKGRPRLTSDNPKLKSWRQDVSVSAITEMGKSMWIPLLDSQPVRIEARFIFQPPKKCRQDYKATRPDIDKLIRGLCDALTGVAFHDDSQVAEILATKVYGETPRTEVEIFSIT